MAILNYAAEFEALGIALCSLMFTIAFAHLWLRRRTFAALDLERRLAALGVAVAVAGLLLHVQAFEVFGILVATLGVGMGLVRDGGEPVAE